jgi:hypothetical protein
MVLVDTLDEVLEETWRTLSSTYDVSGELPEIEMLFRGADLADPYRAAETVLVNMLSDIIESVGRFSPWYTKPARAFGLITVREETCNRVRWILAPEAAQRWQPHLQELGIVIQRTTGLLEATLLVENLTKRIPLDDPCVTAACCCNPRRIILINKSVINCTEIICHDCERPFRIVKI